MKCPNCEATLVMADRQGVEIDYCPSCRGVWLDRGELDKIIERSATLYNNPGTSPDKQYPSQEYPKYNSKGDYRQYDDPHYRHKKKKGFLGDLFDFD